MSQLRMFKTNEIPVVIDVSLQRYNLGFFLDLYETGKIQPAPFQREYCWDKKRKLGFARTLASGKRLKGTIVLYCINPNGVNLPPYYIADGWQRLNCTIEIMRDPPEFGIDMTSDEFKKWLYSASIGIDTDVYDDHYEGFAVFRQVNLGLALHAAEFNKGHFMNIPDGMKIANEIESIVDRCDQRISSVSKGSRSYELNLTRGAYALFLQFLRGHKSTELWNYSAKNVNTSKPTVEEMIVEDLSDIPYSSISHHLKNFKTYLELTTATIESCVHKHTGNYAEVITRTLFRTLLHVGIYKKNVKLENQYFEQGIDMVLKHINESDGRLRFPFADGHEDTDSLRLSSFSPVLRLFEHFDIPTKRTIRAARKKKYLTGYDDSHKLPFVPNGNGETFPEPGSRNRARGAKPVEDGQS